MPNRPLKMCGYCVFTQPGPTADYGQADKSSIRAGECMDQQYIISIVQRAGVSYESDPTVQESLHFVRFVHGATARSLNLGYRSSKDVFVADFVFMARDASAENQVDLGCFLRLFGGKVGKRPTLFARLEPSFSQEAWLIDVIRAYWAMGTPLLET